MKFKRKSTLIAQQARVSWNLKHHSLPTQIRQQWLIPYQVRNHINKKISYRLPSSLSVHIWQDAGTRPTRAKLESALPIWFPCHLPQVDDLGCPPTCDPGNYSNQESDNHSRQHDVLDNTVPTVPEASKEAGWISAKSTQKSLAVCLLYRAPSGFQSTTLLLCLRSG